MTGFVLAVLLSMAQAATPQGPVIPKAPDADAILSQAVQLHEAGDILGAITGYEAYLKVDPNNAGVHSNLGAAYVRLGRFDDGIAEYRKALTLDPASPTFRFNLAIALYKGGRYVDAVRELQTVVAASPQHKGCLLYTSPSPRDS